MPDPYRHSTPQPSPPRTGVGPQRYRIGAAQTAPAGAEVMLQQGPHSTSQPVRPARTVVPQPLPLDVDQPSLAGPGVVLGTYRQGIGQLWRVEAQVNGQFRLLNLENDLALEVPGDFLRLGAAVDQGTYTPVPDLATGGLGLSNGAASSYPAVLAFDGLPGTYWGTPSVPSAGYPVWLEYQYPNGGDQLVTQYNVTSGPNAQGQFQASADGTNWTILDTEAAQAFTAREQVNSYPISNSTAFRYYRLQITANQNAASVGVQLAELGLFSQFSGDSSQRWVISPAAGTPQGSFFNLYNAASGAALDVCGAPLLTVKSLCQRVNRPALMEQWTLRVP